MPNYNSITHPFQHRPNSNKEFKHCCTEINIKKSNFLNVTIERYLWSKKNIKYYLMGFKNRVWKYYKDKNDFLYYEKIKTNNENGCLKKYIETVNKFQIHSESKNCKNELIESHNIYLDSFGNKYKSEFILDNKVYSTIIWQIEYQ